MAENDESSPDPIMPSFPLSKVKKIMKLDQDINKVNAEALHLISCSTDLFLELLAEKSAEIAVEKKRKIVKPDHIRAAVKRHRPTSDFLLDSLPEPAQAAEGVAVEGGAKADMVKPAPAGTRRIDQIFSKSGKEKEAPNVVIEI